MTMLRNFPCFLCIAVLIAVSSLACVMQVTKYIRDAHLTSRVSDLSVSVRSLSGMPGSDNRIADCDVCQQYDLKADGTVFDYPCRDMNVQPVVPICLYPIDKDIYVSHVFWKNKTWEPVQMSSAKKWLSADPELGLIDVGANIGAYTLQIASIGRNVVAVEPNIENARRLHKAITLGKLEDRIVLLNNAVSNERGISKFVFDPVSQGSTRVEQVKVVAGKDYNSHEYIKSIVMNDLLPYCNFTKAIMKVDIEGFEHRAFAQAGELFDKIHIPYVQMEWFNVREHGKKPGHDHVEDNELFTQMMSFFVERHYIPLDVSTEEPVDLKNWYHWPMDVIWKKT